MSLGLPVHDLALFVGAALLLNLTPGPDMLYVAGTAAARGRTAGVLAALGVGAGCVFHTLLAALGVSALIAASDLAFAALKWAGAAYLVWSGLVMLRPRRPAAGGPIAATKTDSPFWQGALINALNPKVALFFLAFLPQFIDPSAPAKVPAFLLLGFTFVTTGTLWCLILACFASALSEKLRGSTTIATMLNRAVGSLFVFLGVRLAVSR